jgi:GT2 family glycosyltransferase
VMAWQGVESHVVVVDNESTEQSKRALRAILKPECLVSSNLNLGYGGGNNLGIKCALAAMDKYILLLNADTEIGSRDVGRLLERLNNNPDISILAPVIREGDEGQNLIIGSRDIARHPLTRVLVSADRLKQVPGYPLHEVDYVTGTVFLARASVFKNIGLLDEEYFFGGEIADFCKRARLRGHRICVDLEIEAQHDTSQTPQHIRETLYRYYNLRNRFLYVRKHQRGVIRYFAYWSLAGAAAFTRALCLGKIAKARAILIALWHAYLGRYGNQNADFI